MASLQFNVCGLGFYPKGNGLKQQECLVTILGMYFLLWIYIDLPTSPSIPLQIIFLKNAYLRKDYLNQIYHIYLTMHAL